MEHRRFSGFLTADPFDGLGIAVEYARRIVGDDKQTLDLLDQALQGRQGTRTDLLDNVQEVKAPTGNSESAALRRLRKDRPDLHAQVLNGELSAHAAAVQAGFRPKTFTVRTDDPDRIVATLRRQLPPGVLAKVIHLLEGW